MLRQRLALGAFVVGALLCLSLLAWGLRAPPPSPSAHPPTPAPTLPLDTAPIPLEWTPRPAPVPCQVNPAGSTRVPFTRLSGVNELEFEPAKLQATLQLEGGVRWELPPRTVPQALLKPGGRRLVVLRHLFSGRLSLVSWKDRRTAPVELPEHLQETMFKAGHCIRDELLLVLYNVHTRRSYLHRFLIGAEGQLRYDRNFVFELSFSGRYEITSPIWIESWQETTFLLSEGVVYRYRNWDRPALDRVPLPAGSTVREVRSSPHGPAALCQGLEEDQTRFFRYDLASLAIEDLLPAGVRAFRLEPQGKGWSYSLADTRPALIEALRGDLSRLPCGGLSTFGVNNFEGRVAWGQTYALNGLIDLLIDWSPRARELDPRLQSLRQDLRRRLDLELYLLDRLLEQGQPQLYSKRYSMKRVPALYAVQGGRISRLFHRYLSELPDPLPLPRARAFIAQTLSLQGFQEVVKTAEAGDPDLPPGRRYLAWPRAKSVFPYDGLNLPFNHQNDWAGGVAAICSGGPQLEVARDIVQTFLDLEGFHEQPPPDFTWSYSWGRFRRGWEAKDEVSTHRPEYPGDRGVAHISYRSIDAMATLSIGLRYPDALPPELAGYFCRAISAGKLYPFVAEELAKHGVLPRLSPQRLLEHWRISAPWELQNGAWSFHYLMWSATQPE